jgi:tetratricopeptide (TPR) repeat protein
VLRALLAAALAATSCATLRPECAAHGADPWLELTSAHFDVKSNLDPEPARRAVLDLERSLALLRHAFPVGAEPAGLLEVVVFRDIREVQDLIGTTVYVGQAMSDWHGALMVLGNSRYLLTSDTDRGLVLHELTHHVASWAFVRHPRWLSEGLAMYFETATIDDQGAVRVGDALIPALNRMRALNHLSLDQLWGWDADVSDPAADPDLLEKRYGSSWLFVHYLFNRREKQLGRWFKALAAGDAPRTAFAKAFSDVDLTRLDDEVETYLEGASYRAHAFVLGAIDERIEQRALPDADAHGLFARIAAQMHDREQARARVQQELTLALGLDPTAQLPLELQVLSQRDAARAAELARALTTSHPDDARAWRLLGATLAHHKEPLTEVVAALRKAYALAPDDSGAAGDLAAALEAMAEVDEAVLLAKKAVLLAPGQADLQVTLARALAHSGRCDEAAAALDRARELFAEGLPSEVRVRFLERARSIVERCPK